MKPSIRLLLLLAAAGILAAACSVSRLAYTNATPVAMWYLGGYVDLHSDQKDLARAKISRALAWHRQTQLPEYRRFLESVGVKLEGKVTADDARTAYRQVRTYYHRAIEHVLPDVADFALQLEPRQAGQIEHKFDDENRKLVKESVKGTVEDRRNNLIKRYVGYFEDFTGRLSPAQREIVAARVRAFPDLTEERLGDRRYRQTEALALIRAKSSRDEMVKGLRRLLIDTETWRRPEYTQKLMARDERIFEAIAELSATLTPEQRGSVQRRLRGYVADITSLAAS